MKGIRAIWPNLPVLLVGSVLVAIGWSATRVLAGLSSWLIPAGVWLLVLPPLVSLVAGCGVLLRDEHFGIGTLLRGLPRTGARVIMITAFPMIMVVLTLVGWHAWQLSENVVMVPSVVAGSLICTVLLVVGSVAAPYRLRTAAGAKESWLVAAFIASRQPVPVLAIAAAATLCVWVAAHLSFAMIILLPAPLAMIWAAAVEQATLKSKKTISLKGS